MTNLQIAKLYLAANAGTTATALDAAITDGSALTAVNALTQTALLNAAYQAAFGRDADAEGLAYWGDRLDNGLTTTGLVDQLVAGAVAYVAPTAANPLVIGGVSFTAAAVGGENDVAVAASKATVEATAANINVAEAALLLAPVVDAATEATAATAVSTDYVVKTAALTTSNDELTGAKANDTFTGSLLSVNPLDSIVDTSALDSDTLDMEINANVSATFTTTNVENINATLYGALTVDMTKMTGVETLDTVGSTGALTVTNANNAEMIIGFENSVVNTMTVGYKAGILAGAADNITVNLNDSTTTSVTVDAGFETAAINTNGTTNTLTGWTVPGVTQYTIAGTGALDIADTLVDGATVINATGMTSAFTTGGITAATGLAVADIVGATTGTSLLLGSGNDTLGFTDATTSGSNTVKLGAGDDTLTVDGSAAAARGTFVFAEAGDDTVVVSTSVLTTGDLIDAGEGTDTVQVDLAGVSNMVLKGVENLQLTNNATGTNVVTSSDTALNVTVAAAGMVGVGITGLTAGSTFAINDATGSTAGLSSTITVGYAANAAQAATTLDINSIVAAGGLAVSNVANVTVDLAKDANMATTNTSLTGVTDFTVTGAALINTGTITDATATTDVLKNITVSSSSTTAGDTVSVGVLTTSTAVENVSVSAVKGVTVGTMTSSDKLASVNYTSTADTVAFADIGSATVTKIDTIAVSAVNAITANASNTIDALEIGSINIASSAGAVTVGAIADSSVSTVGNIIISGATTATTGVIGDAATDSLADVTVTATNGALTTTTLTTGTLGTVNLTSTAAAIVATSIAATDVTGITVNMNAKTFIDNVGDGVAAQAVTVTNNDGDVTASISGDAKAQVDFTATQVNDTNSIVNVTASNTGGLVSTIVNAATVGDASTSTVTLGNADTATIATKVNTISFDGTVDNIVVNGGTGSDTVNFVATNATKVGTFALGDGTDTVDFTNISFIGSTPGTGVAINLSAAAVKFDADTVNETSVAIGGVEEYSSTATKKVIADGFDYNLSGVEVVIGTAGVDYIVANGAGTTISGGLETDTIVLGSGDDIVNLIVAVDDDTEADTITGFASTSDKLYVSAAHFDAAHSGTPLATLLAADVDTIAGIEAITAGEFASFANAAALTTGSIAGSTDAEEFIYLEDTDTLYWNDDAAGAGGLTAIATGITTLVAADIQIIA